MGHLSLIHVVNFGAVGTRGSPPKVASSLLCLGLGALWPPTPHMAFWATGPLLVAGWPPGSSLLWGLGTPRAGVPGC